MVFIDYYDTLCRFCTADLYYSGDPLEHYLDSHHICYLCDRQAFSNPHGLHQHYEARHAYCKPCERVFKNENSLSAHLRSRIHQPAAFKCPMMGCTQRYVSAAAVVLHLESGTCVSGVTRRMIDDYIVQHDLRNIITNPSRLIAGPAGERRLPASTTTYIATERSWNGDGYECYFCHKEFSYLAQLNQHLASPKHTRSAEEKIYRCPNRECAIQKATLSGLCQHIESGSCGVNRFTGVKDTMDNFVSGMRRLAL